MNIKNVRKIIASISALALSAVLFTACSGNDGNEENTSTPSETSAVTENDTSETAAETGETSAEDIPEDDGEGETDGAESASANPLQPLMDAILAVGEWPALMEVTDPMILLDFFLLNAENENYRNLIVYQCPMSSPMTELIIIEADDVEAAKTDLEACRTKAIEQDAFYPNDVDVANASIVGTEGDYAYFILTDNVAEAEPALIEAIKAL